MQFCHPVSLLKGIRLFLLVFFLSFQSWGKDRQLDSLQLLLKKTTVDSNKSNILNQLSRTYYLNSDYEKAKEYGLQAKAVSEKAGFRRGLALADKNIGNVYLDQNDYPHALEFQLNALQVWKEINDRWGIANSTTNVGNVYSALSDYKKAIEFYLQAQKIYEELHKTNTVQYVNTLYNLATAYKGMENYKQALEVYQRSLELYQKLGDEGGVSIALLEIGSIFKDSHLFEDFSKALKYYFQALPLFEKANDVNNLALLYFNIGAIYRAQENYQKAKLYTEKSLRIAQDNGLLKHIFEAESLLNVIYEDLHDYRKALMHYKNFVQLKDSTLNEESMKQVSGLEFKIKENEIRLEHQKEQIRAEAELRHQKTIRYAFTIGFGLVLILAFVILWSLRQTRIKNKIIEQQKAEVETQHQLIEHKQKEILDSITYARRIQHALLASENLLNENLSDYFVLFKPKDIVSGDFYWASRHNELFYIIAADSTGHGVPGAFMSLLNISFLNDALAEKQIKEPNQILNHVRENLIRSLKDDGSAEGGQDGMDCVLCSFDFSGLTLDYAAANNSFYILRNRELIVCKADKMPVGKSPKDGVSFEVRRVDLQKGDIVYIFTDGLPDQFGGPKGKKLKYKPFEEKLIEICGLPMPEQKPLLDKMFEDWRGEYEQVDDVLVIGVKI